jgi:acyl-CoA reductase-like NAD-dependent aldehyde dehydrogenase
MPRRPPPDGTADVRGEPVIVRDHVYLDGRWRRSSGTALIDVHSARDGSVIGRVADAAVQDVDAAVAAARRAFPYWSALPASDRLALLKDLADGLRARAGELAELITREVGTPLRLSRLLQADAAIATLDNFHGAIAALELEEQIGASTVVREPVGVVACITAWNYPLQQVLGKVGAALATGCTAVLKPSEAAPLSAFIVAEVINEIGFPPGVFNLVTGTATSVGEPLVAHPGVDMVHLTGSTGAGRRVAELGAGTVKRMALELGGKSANVILDDANTERAVKVGVANCFTNSGQTCAAWSRMLVHRSQLTLIEDLVRVRAAGYRLGDPLDPGTNMGPLVSAGQQRSVRGHIERALAEGARLVYGGSEQPQELPNGFFVRPTVVSDVTPEMSIAQEEVFGPVLAILAYESDEEAIDIANSTIYGLAGGVWSRDPARAERVARRIRAGQIDINGSFFNPLAPFGGFGQSGIGRELGVHGLMEFYELKSIQRA